MHIEDKLNKRANDLMKGAKVRECRYMSTGDADMLGWSKRPLIIVLEREDGTLLEILAQRDDEGNDAGALSIYSPTSEEESGLFGTFSND